MLAPVLDCGFAVIGDVEKFVTAGDARLRVQPLDGGVRLVVLGAGEDVTITGWAEQAPLSPDHMIDHDRSTGLWQLTVAVPPSGWTSVGVLAGS